MPHLNKIIDLETAPLPDVKERIQKLYPFDPDKVALGNAKKPETVERVIEEARQQHVPKLLEKAQLDPALSYVCGVGMVTMEEPEKMQIDIARGIDDEKTIVSDAIGRFHEKNAIVRLVGWNVKAFDMAYLWKRLWINGMKAPALLSDRGWNDVTDLMKHWCCYQYGEYAKLELVAKILGVESSFRKEQGDCSGKDFYKFVQTDPQKAIAYLGADVEETLGIAQRIL